MSATSGFLFIDSWGVLALTVLFSTAALILSIIAVCKSVALGQRPINQIVRDAEDRRHGDRRQPEYRVIEHELVDLPQASSGRWLWTCSCGVACLPNGYTERDTAFERWAAHARSSGS